MSELTPHQHAAFDRVLDRLVEEHRFTSLCGYAGTGKTFLIGILIDRLVVEGYFVRVCAPTHKAAQVLRGKIQRHVPAQTIHSLLGLRLVPDKKGGYKLELEKGRKLPDGGIIIVDEASMIGMDEWEHIERAAGVQWLFVGDPAQLPPVNESESPVFHHPGPMLEEIVRQGHENPILDLATSIRNQGDARFEKKFNDGEGYAVTRNRGSFLESAIRAFSTEDFEKDGSFARVLAYRNKTVRHYNKQIRDARYGAEAPRFVQGEWLVARDSWYFDNIPYLVNSEEVRILDAFEDETGHLDGEVWKVWTLEVKGLEDVSPRYLTVLHEDEDHRYARVLTRLKKEALADKGDWKPYYKLKEMFASVDYAYASTVHKAQGSTFNTAFVDYRDTRTCRGKEKRALVYVAVTRPSKRLALLV